MDVFTGGEPREEKRSNSKRQAEIAVEDLELWLLKDGAIDRTPRVPIDGSPPEDLFISDSHQVVPSRIIAPHTSTPTLLLDMAAGSGKSHAATTVLIPFLERIAALERSIESYTRALGIRVADIPSLPRPVVSGNWATVSAFLDELLRPMFGIITEEEYAQLKAAKDEAYDEIYSRLTKRILSKVSLMSPSKLLNRFFRGSLDISGKDETQIAAALADGRITIDANLVSELNGSILIVDEPQLLYSAAGLNSYGYLFETIMQHPDIKGMRLLLLSGTFINTSPIEIVYLANLIRPKETPRLEVDTYFRKEPLSGTDTFIYVPRSKELALQLVSQFDGKVCFYPLPTTKDYPTLSLEGELLQIGSQRMKWLRLHRCYSSPYQWDVYTKTTSSAAAEGTEAEEECEARDLVVPPPEDWRKYGVKRVPGATDVYDGEFLIGENLAKFGAIPYEFIRFLDSKLGRGEKVMAYHRRVEKGGILQYIPILRNNGYTIYGENPSPISKCILCGKPFSEHTRIHLGGGGSGEMGWADEMKGGGPKSPDHAFRAAYVAALIGRISGGKRRKVLNKWNSPQNLYGHQIFAILLSGIGERGLTLLATNHVLMLDSIPGVSHMLQIIARVRRHSTHKALPADKRWVQAHVFCISPPKGLKDVHSAEEIRYLLRELNDANIKLIWRRIQARSINCVILPKSDTPEKERSDSTSGGLGEDVIQCERRLGPMNKGSLSRYEAFYFHADVEAVSFLVRYILKYISPLWRLDELKRLIRSNSIRKIPWSTAYISDDAIHDALGELAEKGLIQLTGSPGKGRGRDGGRDGGSDGEIVVIKASAGVKALSIFSNPIVSRFATWTPLGREVTTPIGVLQSFVDRIRTTRGLRERQNIFDQLIERQGAMTIIREDYLKRGPIYTLFRQLDGIVMEGDEKDITTFVTHKLEANGTDKPLGFIIGPEYHSCVDGKTWVVRDLAITKGEPIPQWDLCGIYSPGAKVAPGRWQMKFKLLSRQETKPGDLRKIKHGMACLSIPDEVLKRYAKLLGLGNDIKKTELCSLIQADLLKRQLAGKTSLRYIYSPFDSVA